jgi:hypothetical protein
MPSPRDHPLPCAPEVERGSVLRCARDPLSVDRSGLAICPATPSRSVPIPSADGQEYSGSLPPRLKARSSCPYGTQGSPGTPTPASPRNAAGRWTCSVSPWLGLSPAGWQFMQRGLVMTFAASAKRARDRAARSAISENALGGGKPSGTCAIALVTASPPTIAAMHTHADNAQRICHFATLPLRYTERPAGPMVAVWTPNSTTEPETRIRICTSAVSVRARELQTKGRPRDFPRQPNRSRLELGRQDWGVHVRDHFWSRNEGSPHARAA